MEIKSSTSSKVVSKFRVDLTTTLNNIVVNCNVVLLYTSGNDAIVDMATTLISEIEQTTKWYTRHCSKNNILDYLKDYSFLDKRFIQILEILPKEYDYFLCLEEGRFKLTYRR